MSRLPNAANATLDDAKVSNYLLDLGHPKGSGKAKFFIARGFTLADWRQLKSALLDHARSNQVHSQTANRHGEVYEITCSLTTPDNTKPLRYIDLDHPAFGPLPEVRNGIPEPDRALTPGGLTSSDRASSVTAKQGNVPMSVYGIDHIQLAMPPGREAEARAFYEGLLGIPERPKPPELAKRGGCWFEAGALKVHLGVEAEFRAARKAHPAFLVTGLRALAERLEAAGHRLSNHEPLPGYDRVFVDDPFGNRIELMEPLERR